MKTKGYEALSLILFVGKSRRASFSNENQLECLCDNYGVLRSKLRASPSTIGRIGSGAGDVVNKECNSEGNI